MRIARHSKTNIFGMNVADSLTPVLNPAAIA